MKFWELVSIFRKEPQSDLESILAQDKWERFREYFAAISQLVESQDRAKLDESIPSELEEEVLRRLNDRFVIDGNTIRRANDFHSGLSALEVARTFGGSIIEEIQEYGSAHIKRVGVSGSGSDSGEN